MTRQKTPIPMKTSFRLLFNPENAISNSPKGSSRNYGMERVYLSIIYEDS